MASLVGCEEAGGCVMGEILGSVRQCPEGPGKCTGAVGQAGSPSKPVSLLSTGPAQV
jgi:hypothetical protein